MLFWSAVIALTVAVMVVIVADIRSLLGNWAFPLAIALGVYGLGFIGTARALDLSGRFKQLRRLPSAVFDREGLITEWSVRVPWGDVTDFSIGRTKALQCPCVLVSNITAYRRPWWDNQFMSRLEPLNALPLLWPNTGGYLVRRDALGALQHVGDQELIAELREFRSHLGVGKGVRVLDHAQVESGETSQRPARGSVRLWDYATVAYFIGVLIALYLSTSRDWDWLPPRLLVAALSLVFVSFGIRAIYTGEVWGKGGVFYRSTNPIMYWLLVAILFSFGIVVFLGGIGVIGP